MPSLGYVFPIGGGYGTACERCKNLTESENLPDAPEFYGPTTLEGDAVCEGCNRFIRDLPNGRA